MFNSLNNVFTKRNLLEIKDHQQSKYLDQALTEYQLPNIKNNFVANFNTAYQYLAKNYRNEYFIKNEMLNQMVLAQGTKHASAFRELPIDDCIADFIVNNTNSQRTQVFEIKTDLDTLKRLPNQIANYYHAFPFVNIITVNKHLPELKKHLPTNDLGIYLFDNDNHIKCLKSAKPHFDQIEYQSIFKILRKAEYEKIIFNYYHELPDIDAFHQYEYYYHMFKQIPLPLVQLQLEQRLKSRYLNIYPKDPGLMWQIPYCLREVVYFANFSRLQVKKLIKILNRS